MINAKQDITKLITVKNYANKLKVTTPYIYRLIKQGKLKTIVIDGFTFIDLNKVS